MRRGFGLQRSKALKFNFYEEKPPHSSLLSSYSLEELRGFCTESDINYAQFIGDPEEKKKIMSALSLTYPPDPIRNYHLKLIQLENELNIIEDRIEEQGNNKITLESSCSQETIQSINDMFHSLLTKLNVVSEKISKLSESFSLKEKITYLRNSICVLDDDSQFMLEDEIMLATMQSERYVDSIRLLTCKYRIIHGNQDWLRTFCMYGGISVLVQNMDNVLQKKPMENTDAATLLELILCLKRMMQTDGLNVAIATRGVINTFVQSLRFEYPTLAKEVLGILSVVCTYGGSEGVIQTGTGFHYIARIRKERPFQILVDALILENSYIQSAVIALVNALLNANLGLMERISYRNDLRAVKFNEVLELILGTINNEKSKKKEFETQRLATLERQSSFLQQLPNHYQLGMNLSETGMGPELAEDKETNIHPAEGLMSGICWEAKKSKSGVKRRWYEIKNGVLSWYHLEDREKNINCAANGSLSMTTVVEVLGYSTSPELQLIFKHCFVLKCSNGLRYQFGVRDKLTRDRWIVAFQASLAKAVMERDAYSLETKKIPDEVLLRMNGELKKQIEIYKGIEKTDRQILVAYCKFHQHYRSQEIAGFIQHNLSSFGEISPTIEAQYFSLLTELLDTSSDVHKAQKFLEKITTVLNPTLPKRKSSKWKNILKLSTYLGPGKSSRNILEEDNQQIKSELSTTDQDDLQKQKIINETKNNTDLVIEDIVVDENENENESDSDSDDDDEIIYSIENIMESSSMMNIPRLPSKAISTKLLSKDPSIKELNKIRSTTKFTPSLLPEKEKNLQPIVEEESIPPSPIAKPNKLSQDSQTKAVSFTPISILPTESNIPIQNSVLQETKSLETLKLQPKQEKIMVPQPTPSNNDNDDGKADHPVVESSIKKRGSLLAFFPRKNLAYQEPTEDLYASTKPKIIPEVKMRQFHWIKLKPGDLKETIWNSVEEPSIENIRPEIMNAYQDLDKMRRESQQKTIQKAEEKTKKIQLFDGRRTQNISIIYRKLGRSPDDIAAMVIELKKNELTGDIASTLLPLILTPDEENIIRAYDGPEEDLDIAGRVMKKLAEIPRLKSRLKLYLTILTWSDGARKFLHKIDILEESANELRDPKCQQHFIEIFSWVLGIGNYMNGGTNKGQAHGIKLSGLLKLVDYKKNGSRIEHLLHYIIKLIHQSNLSLTSETFYSNWNFVWDAKNISFKQLESELKELEKSLEEAKAELILFHEEPLQPDQRKDPLAIHLKEFVEESSVIYLNLYLKLSQVRQLIQLVRQFFGENVNESIEDDPEQVFFQILFDFANFYMRSLKDCVDWMEQKKKSNERALHKLPTFVETNKSDAFKLYEVEQSLTSEDMVNKFKNQIFQRRKTINIEDTLEDESDEDWN